MLASFKDNTPLDFHSKKINNCKPFGKDNWSLFNQHRYHLYSECKGLDDKNLIPTSRNLSNPKQYKFSTIPNDRTEI